MKRLLTAVLSVCACLVLFSVAAHAQSKPSNETGPEAGPNCDITGYKSFELVGTFPIPDASVDGEPGSVTIGPIITPPDGDIINDVVIDLRAAHTYVGDLIATVSYDPDCGGPLAPVSARFLCRQKGTNATPPAPCGPGALFGASSDLLCANQLLFSDEAVLEVANGVNPATVAPGCYKPTAGGAFAIFRGLPKGGCWYLTISDNENLDSGAICQFSVHLRNQHPVPAIPASWGGVKNIYR